MLRADERVWLKCGVEYFYGRLRLSTVVTVGYSSWMMADLPEGTSEVGLTLSRRGEAVEIRDEAAGRPAELPAMVYLPPAPDILPGAMCAPPGGEGVPVCF